MEPQGELEPQLVELEEHELEQLELALQGACWTLTVAEAGDLERLVTHHALTNIAIPSVGLEFQSDRTAGLEMPLTMLLDLIEQDIRDNATQIHNTTSDDSDVTRASLVQFFDKVAALKSVFPWTLELRCPLSVSHIESNGDVDARVTRVVYDVPRDEVQRAQAAV